MLTGDGLNFEQIAALNPDLIIGVSSGITQEEYDILSEIAPTLAQCGDYIEYGMPWRARTVHIGDALGQHDAALALIEEVDAKFAAAREAHPEFAGAEAIVATFYDGNPLVYASQDTSSLILADLGFSVPAIIDEIAGDEFYAMISSEEFELLDVEVLTWLTSSSDETAEIVDAPLRTELDAYAEGREVFMTLEVSGAISFASPLSLGYLLDNLVSELALAADGDPATEVVGSAAVGATP